MAADELFRSEGYAKSTVAAIAARAGVSLQTLYLAWGSKRALLRAATDSAASGGGAPMDAGAWHRAVIAAIGTEDDAATYIAGFARVFVDVASRVAVYWRINRDAAAVDPEAAAEWTEVLGQRRETMRAIAASFPTHGLRPGIDHDTIGDTLWATASPDTYTLLTEVGGRSEADTERWLTWLLTSALTDRP